MRAFLIWICLILISSETTSSATPNLINYQGRLTTPSGTAVPDSTYTVTVSLYNEPTGGTALWTETHAVATSNGLFSVLLGTEWDFGDIFQTYTIVYLGVTIGPDPEMTPRSQLASVAYAFEAQHAYGVSNLDNSRGGTITSSLKVEDSLGIGVGGIGPTEPLDVNGNARIAGKVAISANAGPTTKPAIGERWRDNSIVAWCHVGPNGEIYGSFGVDSVQHVSTGQYLVHLSNTFVPNTSNMIVMAQAYSTIENHILTSVRPLTTSSVEVGTMLRNTSSIWDSEFVVLVTGR